MKTKIWQYVTFPRVLALIALCFLIVFSAVSSLRAQQFVQGYGSDASLQRGMIVRLSEKDSNKVEAVRARDASRMYGVVVDPNDAPFTLSDDDQKVFVATAGRFEILVSDQNGPIQAGDYVTVSSIDGIGMKADDSSRYVIGRALGAFDGSNGVAGTSKAGSQDVALGRVLSDITMAANPLFKSSNTSLPGFLQQSAETITGKPVSAARVYLAFFIAVASLIIAGSLLYSGIRSSIVAIGRNPLSKKSIGRSMTQVVAVALIIFTAGLGTVYLLLKL